MVTTSKTVRNVLSFLAVITVCFVIGCTSTVSYVRPSSLDKTTFQSKSQISKSSQKEIKKEKSSVPVVKKNIPDGGGCPVRLKEKAESYIGVRYKYAGTTRKGMDCSGFVWRVYTDIGFKKFKRTSAAKMYSSAIKVSKNDYRVGDMVFFRNWGRINHVGLYMGNGRFIHASSSKGVKYSSLSESYFKKRFAGVRRRIKCQ